MNHIAVILFSLTCLLSINTFAKPQYYNTYRSTYSEFAEVKKRRCQNCHSKKGLKLNDYGKHFAEVRSDFSNVKDAFIFLEPFDSDDDGPSNIEELEMATHPGVSDL